MPRFSTTWESIQLRRPPDAPGGRAVSYFNEAAGLEGVDSYFNLGYAYWLDGDASLPCGGCARRCDAIPPIMPLTSCLASRSAPWQCNRGGAREGSRKTALVDV